MLKRFRLKSFLVGAALGLIILFWYKPPVKVVYEYPHPDNVEKRVYKDTNGVCYKYAATEVNCDKHEGTLKEYPIQS